MGESQNAWDIFPIRISKQALKFYLLEWITLSIIVEKYALTISYNPFFKESHD